MFQAVEILSRRIEKPSKTFDAPFAEKIMKKKITARIERGDRVIIGRPGSVKVIDFVIVDKEEIKKKSQIAEEKSAETPQLKPQGTTNKGSQKLISSSSSERETTEQKDSVQNDWETTLGAHVEDNAPMGVLDEEDEISIIEERKQVALRGFINPELLGNRDPRKKGLQQEIQALLLQNPDQKMNLVLDLDETLLNSIWVINDNKEALKKFRENTSQPVISTTYQSSDDTEREFLSILRPHLHSFLTEMKNYFKIYIYSHGRRDYVMKLLDKIDPSHEIFNPSFVFRNDGQVTQKTQKDIKNLIPCFSPAQFQNLQRTTVIVDDIYEVWMEETQKNVVPVKRFQPFHSLMQKNNPCVITSNHNKEYIRFPKNYQDFFQEVDTSETSNKYLKSLERYLSQCALQFYSRKLLKKETAPDVRDDLVSQKMTLLSQVSLNLRLLEGDELFSVFKYIALATGANISKTEGRYILINHKNFENQQKAIAAMKETNPSILAVDVKWLVDCFFMNFQLELTSYLL